MAPPASFTPACRAASRSVSIGSAISRCIGDTDGVPNDDAMLYGTYTVDGGATFAPNFRISDGASNSHDAQNILDYGDYTHATFVGGRFYPVWSDNSNSTGTNPDGKLHALDLYTAKITVP